MSSNAIILFGMSVFFLLLMPVIGSYMANVFSGKKTFLSFFLLPVERGVYRVCLIDPAEEMHWKKYSLSVAALSLFGLLAVFALQMLQSRLPFNPEHLQGVPWPLAANTAISFVTNTNWQAYAGENTLSYFVQMLGLTVQNFTSAAVGIAVLLALIRGIVRTRTHELGNFWVDIVRATLYVFLPLSVILAVLLMSQGVIQNLSSYIQVLTLEGLTQILPMGPVASQVAIKQLGTNGGGFFGVNSAHPFENPTGLSNFLQTVSMLLLPFALIYMFGTMIKARRQALVIYMVMMTFFIVCVGTMMWAEHEPNQALKISRMLEGKELRFGITDSTFWTAVTTATSGGSVNAMHDSLSPLTGGVALLQMLLGEIIFGGVGSGLYSMLLFVLLTVFLAGLMVGRTPEYMGKKLAAREMKLILLAILTPSIIVLIGAALSIRLAAAENLLLNHGPHGLTSILYAWASAANNNGSAFAGFDTNTLFFNLALGIAMLLGRFTVIFSVLAIAGNLAYKQSAPPTESSFSTDNLTFGILLASIIFLIGALTFMPVLVLGPIAEQLLMNAGQLF